MLRRFVASAAALVTAACAPAGNPGAAPPADRVLVTESGGQVIRQQALTDRVSLSFKAPVEQVWPALQAAYAEMGIDANYADRASGRYGVRGYPFPGTLGKERRGAFFSCGTTLTGALVDMGTVTSDIVTTVTAAPDGTTSGTVYVVGWLRRSEGVTSNLVACASTGRLEETIRRSVEQKLAAR